jgi:hypothetical protein
VSWQAAGEETEGLRYELERSADGRSFAKIETRASAGTGTEYVHYDLTPVNGTTTTASAPWMRTAAAL